MIADFKCKETERLFQRKRSRKYTGSLQRKLLILDAAEQLGDLRVPPSNHLEKLGGDRRGQYSIRINDQWRICFRWKDGQAHGVEIVDYH